MNPQIVYGEDVMSRIQYTIEHKDGLEKLHKAIIATLNKLLKQAVKTANKELHETDDLDTGEESTRPTRPAGITVEDILEMVLVGNSTMHHLLLNLHPKDLGLAPFVPTIHKSVDVKARELGITYQPRWKYSCAANDCIVCWCRYQRNDRRRRTAQAG